MQFPLNSRSPIPRAPRNQQCKPQNLNVNQPELKHHEKLIHHSNSRNQADMADSLGHSFPCSAQLAKNHRIVHVCKCTTLYLSLWQAAFHWYYINSFTLFSYFHFLKYGRFSHHPRSLPQKVKPPVEYFPTNKTEMSLEDRQPSGAVPDR